MTSDGLGAMHPLGDPEVVGINRLPMRSPLTQRSGNPWFRSLDGEWSVKRFDHPRDVTTDVLGRDVDEIGRAHV